MAVSTRPNDDVVMSHAMSETVARNTTHRSMKSNSPSIFKPPISGLAISWIPNAPLVRPRQLRKTLKAIIANPNDTST